MRRESWEGVTKDLVKERILSGIRVVENREMRVLLKKDADLISSNEDQIEICSSGSHWSILFLSGDRLDGSVLSNVSNRILCDIISSRFPRNDRVVDVVCSVGYFVSIKFEGGEEIRYCIDGMDVSVDLNNMDTYYAAYIFRLYGVSSTDMKHLECILAGIDYLPSRSEKYPDLYVISIDISNEDVAKRLSRKLSGVRIPCDYGVEVFMISIIDSNGLTLPNHVLRVNEVLGGSFCVGFALIG